VLALLQLALLRCLLELVVREQRNQLEECQRAGQQSLAAGSGRSLALHEKLVLLKRHGAGINRRVLKLLFRQLRKLERAARQAARSGQYGDAWPLPTQALFNPVLLASDPGNFTELAQDYLIAALGERRRQRLAAARQSGGAVVRLWTTCRTTGARQVIGDLAPQQLAERTRERPDQGVLSGFLATELLLSGFMAPEEYQEGRTCWIDEPANLRRLLQVPDADANAGDSSLLLAPVQWSSSGWLRFRRACASAAPALLRAGFAERIPCAIGCRPCGRSSAPSCHWP
jgi:hypothetical protein